MSRGKVTISVARVCLVPVNPASCPVRGPLAAHVGPTSRTWALEVARGTDKSHVGPMICVWAAPPTCMSRGLRAYQGVYAHTQGLTCERAMWLSGRYHPGQAPDNVCPDMLATTLARRPTMCASNPYHRELPKTQDTSPLAARFQCFSPRWSVFWAPRPLELWLRRRQSEGITPCKAATRRRHAARRLRMAQNPHRSQPEVRRVAYKSWAQHRLARKSSPNSAPPVAFPRKSSPSTAPPAALPRKSSPSTRKNAEFGVL